MLSLNKALPAKETLVVRSGVSGATVTFLGPEETLKVGIIDANGQVTFTGLPDGSYQRMTTKDGYVLKDAVDASIT